VYEIFAKLLKEKDVTPYQVSKATGVAQSSLSDWKNGRSKPKYEKMLAIADYFGVSVDYLLGNEPKEKTPAVTVYDEHDKIIHLDQETMNILESLRTRPDMKVLFSVSSKATQEDIIKTIKIIEALRDESEGK